MIDTFINIINQTKSSLSNRECAILFWLLIFIQWIFFNKKTRNSFNKFIKCLLDVKILSIYCATLLYIALICFTLYKLSLWRIDMLKDTIIYTISAVIIQTQVTTNNEYNFKKLSVKYITANTFFITVLEFYPFSLGIELILIPIIVLLSICEVFTKNKIEYKKENLLFNIILTLTFISTIINCIIQIIHDPNSIFSRDFVNNLILPIILTLLVLPYYYVWSLYAIYQEFFVRLRHLCKQDGKSYKYRRNAIIRTCNINLKKIRIVNRTMRMAYCETNSDFVKKLDATIRNN